MFDVNVAREASNNGLVGSTIHVEGFSFHLLMAGPRLIDPRLTARAGATRRYLVVAVMVGIGGAVSVVAQAALLASIISRSFFHHTAESQMTPAVHWTGGGVCLCAQCALRGRGRRSPDLGHSDVGASPSAAPPHPRPRSNLAGRPAGRRAVDHRHSRHRCPNVYFGRYLPQAILAFWYRSASWPGWPISTGFASHSAGTRRPHTGRHDLFRPGSR